jgi:hypothetical protein
VHSRPLTIAVLLLLALGSAVSPALAGPSVTTPLLRVADPAGTARGSVQVKLKGQGSSVTVRVSKLDDAVPTPLGVFLEDAPESGNFAQVAAIAVLSKGAGKITLSSSSGPPSELGVATLDDLSGRRLQVRDANDASLLDAVLPGLQPFAGTKLVAKLLPPEGAPAPAASATLTGKPTTTKGSERFRLKAKKLPAGAEAALFIEDAPGSQSFLPAGDLLGGLYQRDTALGDRLPLEVAAQADLVGRAIEVRDGANVLLAGTIEVKGSPSLTFPLTGVIILDGGAGGDDRYLRVVGDYGPLYRSVIDMTQVTAQELADTGEALWRLDKIGQSADGPVVTVTLQGHDDTWWMVSVTGDTHYVHVQKQLADPAGFDYAHFILHMGSPVEGKQSFLIESAYFPGEFLLDQGHILTANGVKVGPGSATFVLHPAH